MRRRRLGGALLLLGLLPLVAGCFGAAGAPLPPTRLQELRAELMELDHLDRAGIDARLKALEEEAARARGSKDKSVRAELGHTLLLTGYCWERRGDFEEAEKSYAEAARSDYASVALMRSAQVALHREQEARARAEDRSVDSLERQAAQEVAKLEKQRATKALERAANFPVGSLVLLREPPVANRPLRAWREADLRYEAYKRLDRYYRERPSYQAFAFLVRLCGGEQETTPGVRKRSYPYLLAIVLIAVLAKLVTTPLSAAQFRSMRAIQAVQPELKKLQEKYKDDKQQLARAQMELFREHKVNPASSCLPMLIQFPILIWVYYAIRYYVHQFVGVRFLYIESLANPDVVRVAEMLWPGPLLLLYGVSMYFSQKLLASPGATPEQQQQQKMLSYLMPVMLVLLLKGLPAAFILYWLLQNILMTGHQWLIIRPQRAAEAAAAAAPVAPPPPEAIRKLSQGMGAPKRKKKRR